MLSDEIIEVEGAPADPKEVEHERIVHTFDVALPRPIFSSKIEGGNSVEIATPAQLLEEFRQLSQACEERGPKYLVVKSAGGFGSRFSVCLLLLVMFAAAVVSVVSYNLSCDESRVWRVIGVVYHNWIISVMQCVTVLFIVFIQFPLVTRRAWSVSLCVLFAIPHPFLYAALWGMFPTKEDYYASNRTTIQRWLSFLVDGPSVWLAFLGAFELARAQWIRHKSRLPGAHFRLRGWHVTQGGVTHVLAYVLHFLITIGVILSAFRIVSFVLGRSLTVNPPLNPFFRSARNSLHPSQALIIVPILSVLFYSIAHKEATWDGGWAVLFSIAGYGACTLANLLPLIMSLGDSIAFVVVSFFTYYLVYGLMFSGVTVIISRMTKSFHSPQFLFILQVFLDAFVGLAFVELDSVSQFWLLLIIQSVWGLLSTVGMTSWLYLELKDAILGRIRGKKPEHTLEEKLERERYLWLLNAQSILSDITCAVAIPIMMSVDHGLRETTGACSISCNFSRGQITEFVKRYAILLSFRVFTAVVVLFSYATRFTLLSRGRAGTTCASVASTLLSLVLSFHLHVWRNLTIFVASSVYMLSYMLYPVIEFHGFEGGSSSQSS